MTTTTTSSTTPPDRADDHADDHEVDTDVVVVGAGPIGLTLACALAHHGVRYRVFEERTAPNETSRANNLWSRPQELLDGIGVRSALAEKAYVISRSNVVVKGKALPQSVHEPSSSFAEPLCTGQDVIETTPEEASTRTGSPVERGRRVLSLSQDGDGVELVVGDERPAEEQDGRGERVRCRYVVGADGNTGTVRSPLGVEIPLEKLEGRATRQIGDKLPDLATRIFGGGDLQQIEVAYPDSPLTEEHTSARPRKNGDTPVAGGRTPDAQVVTEDGGATSVLSSVYGPDGHTWGWCLLGFDGGPDGEDRDREQLDAALAEVGALSWVHPRLVVADPVATGEAAGAVPRLFDLDGAAHDGFGLRGTPALVLTRPDGHIAFRAPAGRGDLLQQYLGRVGAGKAAARR